MQMRPSKGRLAALILTLSVTISAGAARPVSGPIQVTDKFDSGSLGEWRIEGETRLVFVPHKDLDQDRVNSAVTWFHGKISNVLHREVTIRLEGLDYTVYNGRTGNILPFERNTVPVFSYDGETWERFTDCRFLKDQRAFEIRHIFSRDTVWIAYVPPFSFARVESLVTELRRKPSAEVETLGKSVEGRPLYVVSVTEPGADRRERPVVWIIARHHSFEAGGTWAAEGLLRFLTGPDPEARALRRQLLVKVCPMMNPDGVARGGTRFNAKGVDINRHWHPDDPLSHDSVMAPEITLLKEALRAWRRDHRLDLFINLHNNDMVWNDDGDYVRFAPVDRTADARRFETLLRKETIFTGPYDPSDAMTATESVVAADTGALSLLMEMKTGFLEREDRWTGIDVFRAHGRGLIRAAAQLLARPK